MINTHEELKKMPEQINPEAVKGLIGRAQNVINDLQELCAAGYQRLAQLNVMEFEDEITVYRSDNGRVEYRVEVSRFEKGNPVTRFYPLRGEYGFNDFVGGTLAQSFSPAERKNALQYAAKLARFIKAPVIIKGFELRKNESAVFDGVDMVLT